jgi:tRNA-splicing ligase RtcB
MKIAIFAEHLEDEALEQFNEAMSLECNVQGALMPDAHTGYTLPIGAVIKSRETVFPAYVGYDIGCGMCAVQVFVDKSKLDLEKLKNDIIEKIPVGFNRHKERKLVPWDHDASDVTLEVLDSIGVYQIGTLGGGNHFIEIGESEPGSIWIIIHSGSRGFGHKVAERYMKLASQQHIYVEKLEEKFLSKNKDLFKHNPDRYNENLRRFIENEKLKASKNIEGHFGLDINSEIGKQYLIDMGLCLEFALQNRLNMVSEILTSIFKQVGVVSRGEIINRNHNHAEVKYEDDGVYVIHRKGATHAEKEMAGVIPGNMRDGSFIVRGLGNEDSLCSSSHGAGRVLSRKKAKETIDISKFHKEMEGIVSNHNDDTIDEAPDAYKNIFEVMDLQKDLVTVEAHVKPILNIKG